MGERESMVLVEWEDSDKTGGWHNIEDVAQTAPIVSVGFLIRDEEGLLILTQSLNEHVDGPMHRTARLGESITIPRSAIKSVTPLQGEEEK